MKYLQSLQLFFQETLWQVKLSTLPTWQRILYRQLRILVVTFTEFTKDRCGEKASALTYFSLLSIVPVLAMAYGISTIFGLEEYLRGELIRYFSGQQEVLNYALQAADRMLETSSGGVISGISAIFLIYTVGKLMNQVEGIFNVIWESRQGRSLKRKITDYTAVILLGPLLVIASSSLTVFITGGIQSFMAEWEMAGFISSGIAFFLKVLPYTLIWVLLFLIYIVFPSVPVRIFPALIAGIVAGTAFQLTQWGWINGQVYLSRYSVIYGSFAALPLFLIWLQLSWTIILIGAELAFAIQNIDNWAYDSQRLKMNVKTRKKLQMVVLRKSVTHFAAKDGPISFSQLCHELTLPRRFVRELVTDLLAAGLLVQVKGTDETEWLQPGIDIHKLTVGTVLHKLDLTGMNNLPHLEQNEGFDQISRLVDALEQEVMQSPHNQLLMELKTAV